MENIISGVRDSNLKLTLAFGIGIHHAGLIERDRKITEELFVNSKIQVVYSCFTLYLDKSSIITLQLILKWIVKEF